MIDRKALFSRCDGDVGLVKELLEDFVSRCDSEIARLSEGEENLHRHAHRLKGVALNLSMPELRKWAAQVEASSREGEVGSQELSGLRQSLKEACESARSLLKEEGHA